MNRALGAASATFASEVCHDRRIRTQHRRVARFVLAGKSARTREGYTYVTNRLFAYLEQQQAKPTLDALRPMHVRAFIAHARSAGSSRNTIANFDRTLRTIFLRIEREGREDLALPSNWKSPLTAIEKERPVVVRKTPLTAEQPKRLLDATKGKGFIAARHYAQLAFMLMTGARSIEIRHLRLDELDLEHKVARLRTTKGSKPRNVFLPASLYRVMWSYLRRRSRRVDEKSSLVFPTRSEGLQSRRALHRSVQAAGRRIGVPNLGPHRLRHSYITLSHASGAPLKFLQEQCGHSTVLVTQGYFTLSDEQKAELADKFSAFA